MKKSSLFLKKNPKSIELLLLKVFALRGLKKYDLAIKTCQHVLRLNPTVADAHNSLGNIYQDQQKFSLALQCYHQAEQSGTQFPVVAMNIAHAYRQWYKLNLAIEKYQEIITAHPDNAEAHFNISYCYLMMGNYADGWREYEWRWKNPENKANSHNLPQPQWQGESLNGKKLLIHSEQGFGDIIMLARFIALIPSDGAYIILESRLPLLPLMRSSFKNVNTFIVKGNFLPEFDFQIAVPSLPFALKNTLETLPTHVPYLQPDPELIKKWETIIPKTKEFKIGFAWSGSQTNPYRFRACELDFFKPLFRIPNTKWFSLQKGAGVTDLKKYPSVVDLDSKINNFSDTAAAILQLDLIISIDTSVAHLSGALGKPTWTLLSSQTDWRWMLQRQDSVWYPTMRLFRQSQFNDWENLFNRVHTSLLALTKGDTSQLNPIPWQGPPAITDGAEDDVR